MDYNPFKFEWVGKDMKYWAIPFNNMIATINLDISIFPFSTLNFMLWISTFPPHEENQMDTQPRKGVPCENL